MRFLRYTTVLGVIGIVFIGVAYCEQNRTSERLFDETDAKLAQLGKQCQDLENLLTSIKNKVSFLNIGEKKLALFDDLIQTQKEQIEVLNGQYKQFKSLVDSIGAREKELSVNVSEISNVLTKSLEEQASFNDMGKKKLALFDEIIQTQKGQVEVLNGQNTQFRTLIDSIGAKEKELSASVSEIAGVLTESLKEQVLGNKMAAERAFVLAKEAAAKGESDIAEVYFLNAITHLPTEIKILNTYADFILNDSREVNLERVQRFSGILDLAIYQVSPDSILDVQAIRERIIKKQEAILSTETSSNEKEDGEFKRNCEIVFNGKLSFAQIEKESNVSDKLKERLDLLNELNSDEFVVLQKDDDGEKIANAIETTSAMFFISHTLDSVEEVLKKAEGLIKEGDCKKMQIAREQLNAANSLLSQVWVYDCAPMPTLQAKAENTKKEVLAKNREINKILSRDACLEVDKCLREIDNIYGNNFNNCTRRINEIKEVGEKISLSLQKIQDEEISKECSQKSTKYVMEKLKALEKERYLKYQKKALEKLKLAKGRLDSDSNKWDVFHEYLKEINPSLLLPDIGTLYAKIQEKYFGEPDDQLKMSMEKAEAFDKLKTLDDF